MIHAYTLLGHHIVIDVNSGAVHIVDRAAYDVLPLITLPMSQTPPPGFTEEQAEAWGELYTLYQEGLLHSADWDKPAAPRDTPLKALCLHVSHDCNLRCGYCFAHTGDFGTGQRRLMTPETAARAMDMLVERSGNRKNLEVDFFGGEPLMALDTVKQTVDYARRSAPHKNFRFTLTTNGVLLDDDTIDYLNRTMNNIVLSLDGRQDTNDRLRRFTDGRGSYEDILPKFQKLVAARRGDYYLRGTFTAKNLDFTKDVFDLAAKGFSSLSLEPVSLPPEHPLALREEHLPALFREYEILCEAMLKGETDFSFFHFMVDLEQGPCVHKRLRGCGAGYEYAAVTPEGEVYPCHQFVGRTEYRLGAVGDSEFDETIADRFRGLDIDTRRECRSCWARFYCSGGCAASNLTAGQGLETPDPIACELERKRLECAILLKSVPIASDDLL